MMDYDKRVTEKAERDCSKIKAELLVLSCVSINEELSQIGWSVTT